jgi:hypothetical protein
MNPSLYHKLLDISIIWAGLNRDGSDQALKQLYFHGRRKRGLFIFIAKSSYFNELCSQRTFYFIDS